LQAQSKSNLNHIIKPYRYHLRPEYGGEHLLLQFFLDDSDGTFIEKLFASISGINPRIADCTDLIAANDELLYGVQSDMGTFELSIDTWGFAFILAADNQPCIIHIDQLLEQSALFLKEEIDYCQFR